MRIDVYSHSFAVSQVSDKQRKAVEQFCNGLVQYELKIEDGRREMVKARVFASASEHRKKYHFHINMKVDFFRMMSYHGVRVDEMDIRKHPIEIDDRFRADFKVISLHEPRDPQPAIIEHILSPGSNKIVTLQTGKGKTELTKHCINLQGLRTACFMKGGFIDRWTPDLEESFKFKRGEILEIRGGKSLRAIMEMALDGDPIGNINLISTNTFSDYLKDFEKDGYGSGFPIAPIDFFDRLGIGFGVLDEGHQYPHQIMKLFSHMNIHKFLSLSATLDTKNAFLNKMYETMYPRADRFNAGYYDAFIRVIAIKYNLKNPRAIRYKGFGGAYNHNTFEASLMTRKNKHLLETYINMIGHYLKVNFADVMEKGQKAIVFCGTVNMCTLLTKMLGKLFPQLNVVRYVSKDKMSVMNDADVIVSTVLSAGTAVDIKNLRYNLMTTAIDSQQSNEQTLGRTRRLRDWPEITPLFQYFVCIDIDKHVRYHENKEEFFRGKVLAHLSEFAPFCL